MALNHPTGSAVLGLNTLTVTIQNTDLGFPLGGIRRQANGQINLSLTAPGLAQFVLEASTNLTDWVPLGTNVLTLIDTSAPMFNQRFYRVVAP